MVAFYCQKEPGQYQVTVHCPHCSKDWYVVWDDNPGSGYETGSTASDSPSPKPAEAPSGLPSIEWHCVKCGKVLKAASDKAGKTGKCPHCGEVQSISGTRDIPTRTQAASLSPLRTPEDAVDALFHEIQSLPGLSATEVQQEYSKVRIAWASRGLIEGSESHVRSVITRNLKRIHAERTVTSMTVRILDRGAQISVYDRSTFVPIRAWRGKTSFYVCGNAKFTETAEPPEEDVYRLATEPAARRADSPAVAANQSPTAKCDICATPITKAEMKTVPGASILSATEKGYVPARLPFEELTSALGRTRKEIWLATVVRNKTNEWGLCGGCFLAVSKALAPVSEKRNKRNAGLPWTIALAVLAAPLSLWAVLAIGPGMFIVFLAMSVLVVFAAADYSWAREAVAYPFRMLFFVTIGALFGGESAWSGAVGAETEHQQSKRPKPKPKRKVHLNVAQAISVSGILAAMVCLVVSAVRPAASEDSFSAERQASDGSAVPGNLPPAAVALDSVQAILDAVRQGRLSRQSAIEGLTPELLAGSAAQLVDALAEHNTEVDALVFEVLKSTSADLSGARDSVAKLLAPVPPIPGLDPRATRARSSRAMLLALLPRFGFSAAEARQIVRKLLCDGEPEVMTAASEALAKPGTDRSDVHGDFEVLLDAYRTSDVSWHRNQLEESLTAMAPRVQVELLSALKSEEDRIWTLAARLVRMLGESQKFDVTAASAVLNDDRVVVVACAAAVRLRPFPKEGIPLLLARLKLAPISEDAKGYEIGGTGLAGGLLQRFPPRDLQPYLTEMSRLLNHEDSSVRTAASDALAICGAQAVPILGEHYRKSDARAGAFSASFRKACMLVSADDKAAITFLMNVLAADDAVLDMANCASGVIGRIVRDVPSLIPQLIAGLSKRPSESAGAARVCAVLQGLGEPAVDQLLKAAVAEDEAIRYWSLVALRPRGHTLLPTVETQSETFAELTFEDPSDRVSKVAYELLLSIPSERISRATMAIAKKHINSKDPRKQARARTVYRPPASKDGKRIYLP